MTAKKDAARAQVRSQERAEDRAEARRDSRAEDRAEVARQAKVEPVPVPAVKVVKPQQYPKWIKVGDLDLVVGSEAEEKALQSGACVVKVTKSAQGDLCEVVPKLASK